MTSPALPPTGYELYPPELARVHGAQPEMMFQNSEGAWIPCDTCEGTSIHHFAVKLGTCASLTTRLPEVRPCNCISGEHPILAPMGNHAVTCPAHPRNLLVKVLPQLLAGLPEKPEGLLWLNTKSMKNFQEWLPCGRRFPFEVKPFDTHFAYALPRHVLDAIEAGKDDFEDPEFTAMKAQKDAILAREKSNPSQASGPTDGEMLDWLEKHSGRISDGFYDGWNVWAGDSPTSPIHKASTLRSALTAAMRAQGEEGK